MKIVAGYPPNIDVLRAAFNPGPQAVYTYGDTVYNPSGGTLSAELVAHEAVHIKQQAGGAAEWWARYLEDEQFRLEQELEAHRAEYQAFCARERDRNRRHRYLFTIAARLASPMYGGVISPRDALRQISAAR